jgi:hypothetical protein
MLPNSTNPKSKTSITKTDKSKEQLRFCLITKNNSGPIQLHYIILRPVKKVFT